MISVSPWLFAFYILNIRYVIGVRIFQNVLPVPMPTKFVEFVPSVMSKTCMLKPEEGPCRGSINMYYYAPETGNCTSFKWGGCQGNGNRFNTQQECRDKCLSKQGGSKHRPTWCGLTFDYGYCFGAVKRYYFDNLWKVCKTTVYSGCGGNRNNFYSHEQCEAICLYGNGPLTLPPKTVTAPTKVLIINPEAVTQGRNGQTQSDGNRNGDKTGNVGGNDNRKSNIDSPRIDGNDGKQNNNNNGDAAGNLNADKNVNFIGNDNALP